MQNTVLQYRVFPKWYNPVFLFENLFAKEKYSFWLDSSLENNENRFSYMGAKPEKIYSYFLKNAMIEIQEKEKTYSISEDIFTFLKKLCETNHVANISLPFDFTGGLVGYFGYELKSLTGAKKTYQSPYPDSIWYLVDNFVAFDHLEKKVYLVYLEDKHQEATEMFKKIISTGKSNPQKLDQLQPTIINPAITYPHTKKEYLKEIKKCKMFLTKGESYQICLTNTLKAKIKIDPFLLYKSLREKNQAPYATYFKYNDLAILSSSPEQFLKIDKKGTVQTKPIKGTVRRGKTKREDEKLRKELRESAKEWSENAMIVDLMRNDLGKICKFGSIQVKNTMAIESYQTVHQLVSTITGKLRKDTSVIDCVKACFPGGSMTGAPKIRTMEIIDKLEKQARGIYSGALGYVSFNQTLMLNIIIRTIIIDKNNLTIGAGGAILINSVPSKEYDEMLLKTKAILESIKSAVYTTHMHTVYLALGSNIGDKKKHINNAVKMLEKHIENMQLTKIYETKPMYFEDQDNFLNTVIKGQTTLSPQELITAIKNTENELGRKKRFQNGPREIDIDILFYDELIYESKDLVIPHPRISERDFVLKPFADLDPDFTHPVLNKKIKELLKELPKEK